MRGDKKLKKVGKGKGWLFWTPRIASILLILFLALFSLDIFDGSYGFWGVILGLLMHNIPSIVLAIFLIVFWNRGIFPGVIFILGGITYIVLLLKTIVTNTPHQWYMLFWGMVLAVPAFVVGILFILDWKRRKKNG